MKVGEGNVESDEATVGPQKCKQEEIVDSYVDVLWPSIVSALVPLFKKVIEVRKSTDFHHGEDDQTDGSNNMANADGYGDQCNVMRWEDEGTSEGTTAINSTGNYSQMEANDKVVRRRSWDTGDGSDVDVHVGSW